MSTVIEIDKSQDDLQDGLLGDPQYTLMELSPNGKYLVTYNEESKKFVGWNVGKNGGGIKVGEYIIREEDEGIQEGGENDQGKDKQVELEDYEKDSENIQAEKVSIRESGKKVKYKQDSFVEMLNHERRIRHMCVSDDKILAYTYDYRDSYINSAYIGIIDMNTGRKIELNFKFDKMDVQFCNFNSKGELILWCTGETNIKHYGKYEMMNIVCVYSIQSRKTKCQKIYTISIEAEVISISKNDKIWLRFNNNIYEWDIHAVYTTIILKYIYKVKDIKVFNNYEYTCFKFSNNRIIVYSNQLGFSIASFDLKYLNDRKRDKLIKRIYNLMIDHPSLSCLLLSLLDNTYLNELIENSQSTSGQSNVNSLNLFYSEQIGSHYRFVHNNHHIQVDEFKLNVKKKSKANNYEHEHLSFSNIKNTEDVLGKYQLEKGSIFWKFKFEEEQDASVVELKLKKIKEKTSNLVKKLDNQINKLKEGKVNDYAINLITDQIDTFKERLKEFEDWQSDDDLVRGFEIRINEMQKWKGTLNNWKNIIDIGNSDKINKIKSLIKELIEILDKNFTEQIRHKIKIKLENYFVGQINEKDLMKSFIDGIQKIIKFEDSKILNDEFDTKKIKNLEGNLQEKNTVDIVGNFDKFDDKESAKKFVKEKMNDKLKELKENLNRDINVKDLVSKFAEVIEIIQVIIGITKIEASVSEINAAKVKKSVRKFIEWVGELGDINSNKRITKFKKLENLIKEIEITKIKELEEDPINLADDFIKYIETKIEELEEDPESAKDIIHDIRKTKIDKLKEKIEGITNEMTKEITEDKVTELINDIVRLKINEELVKDSIERITKFERLKNEHREGLLRDFIKRKNKVEELAKESNKFEIEIGKESLLADKDLIRLFCDTNLNHIYILAEELLNSNEIAIITSIGFFIFHLNGDVRLNYKGNKNEKLISLNYFHYIHQPEQGIKKIRGQQIDCDSKLIYGWVSYVKNNNEDFLKYGTTLLMFAIEINDLELIDSIYMKCLELFNQDLENNKAFLSIITTSMGLLSKYYPEYITRFSLDTNMIIDSPDYEIVYLRTSHLHSFSDIVEIVDLTRSIFWTKYTYQVRNMMCYDSNDSHVIIRFLIWTYFKIETLILILTFPISFPIFHILNYFNIINEIFAYGFSKLYYRCYYFISEKFFPKYLKPTITFIIPYIRFVSYPNNYYYSWRNLCWWKELIKPEPSPFIMTRNRAIYKTWSGEALINFKWNSYGKYYYFAVWIMFNALLGCFTAATTFSEDFISDYTRAQLLIASIILGLIHLSIEVRQIIYDPTNLLDWFEMIIYSVSIGTSINWLYTTEKSYFLIAISCLLLDFKFLLFFRVFKSFSLYFTIIVRVANKVASFLVVLFIILASFAHAFLILLRPRNVYSLTVPPSEDNDDPNNPWRITSSYYQENSQNPLFTQQPDKNTNMFTDYGTSLFSMFLYLTGDSSSLSNWEYKDNPSLAILMVLFSLLIVVYLMNLFIGLLTNYIGNVENESLYLLQKVKILAEIELFYLFPNQRRWKALFPDVIYYHADANETCKKIKELIKNDELYSNEYPNMKKKYLLLNKLKVQDPHREIL